MRHILPLRVPGRAAGGHVLADRAQKPSAGTAGRLPVQCHVHNPPVCEAAASPVSRRCTAVPIGAEGAARSALKATSEVGTGGPATRIIEADVLPTSPGRGDACGALGIGRPRAGQLRSACPHRAGHISVMKVYIGTTCELHTFLSHGVLILSYGVLSCASRGAHAAGKTLPADARWVRDPCP